MRGAGWHPGVRHRLQNESLTFDGFFQPKNVSFVCSVLLKVNVSAGRKATNLKAEIFKHSETRNFIFFDPSNLVHKSERKGLECSREDPQASHFGAACQGDRAVKIHSWCIHVDLYAYM